MRLLLLALLLPFSACDQDGLGSFGEPAPGSFALRVGGGSSTEHRGQATFKVSPEYRSPIPGGEFLIGGVEMRDNETSRLVASIGLYVRPVEGGQPDDVQIVAQHFQVHSGGEWYFPYGGTVDVEYVSESEVSGEFDVDLRCCGNAFGGIPERTTRARGRFNATYDGPFYD